MNPQMEPVTITRILPVPRARIYQAWTSELALAQWFAPQGDWSCDMKADVRVGGAYRFEMRSPDDVFIVSGTYERIFENELISFTWKWEDTDFEPSDSLVTVRLEDAQNGTLITITHERLSSTESEEEHSKGWNAVLNRLEEFLPKSE